MRFFQFKDVLLEANHNDPSIANKVLTAPIQCGFEAEILLPPNLVDLDDYYFDQVLTWDQLADIVSMTSSIFSTLYRRWLAETDEFKEELEHYIENDEELLEYVLDYVAQSDIEEPEDASEEEVMEYVMEHHRSEFVEWMIQGSYGDDIIDPILDRVGEERTIADFLEAEYTMEEAIDTFGGEHAYRAAKNVAAMTLAARLISDWAKENSSVSETATGSSPDRWGIVRDDSINPKIGVITMIPMEIISPAFDTPEEMLYEMAELFKYLNSIGAGTNGSTGLHVTMSWAGPSSTANYAKMAVLLDDPYILKQFDRIGNKYTSSLNASMMDALRDSIRRGSLDRSLSALDAHLNNQIDDNNTKYNAMHIKHITNHEGNPLIEFRIAGGENYLKRPFQQLKSTVVRYGISMMAGYDPEFLKRDYYTKLARMLEKAIDTTVAPTTNAALRRSPVYAMINKYAPHKAIVDYIQDVETHKTDPVSVSRIKAVASIVMIAKLLRDGIANKTKTTVPPSATDIKAFRDWVRSTGIPVSDVMATIKDASLRQWLEDFMG